MDRKGKGKSKSSTSSNKKQQYKQKDVVDDYDDDEYDESDYDENDDAKMEFEKEREKILNDLPTNVTSMFGQIGFMVKDDDNDNDSDDDNNNVKKVAVSSLSEKQQQQQQQQIFVPVLIVSPYDVPPKPIRDIYWFDLYSRTKRAKNLSTLPYLIYHYGSMVHSSDPNDCYSFLNNNEFIYYTDGINNGYDQIPIYIQNKIQCNQSLTNFEQMLYTGLREMKEDCLKTPAERKRGISFQERYQQAPVVQVPIVSKKVVTTTATNNTKKSSKTVVKAAKAKTTTKKQSPAIKVVTALASKKQRTTEKGFL